MHKHYQIVSSVSCMHEKHENERPMFCNATVITLDQNIATLAVWN